MKNKSAFTLVETLIMVAVIGVIATVTVVSLKGMRPDKDVMMIKKAYSTTVQIVNTLANDTELYPYAKISGLLEQMIYTKNSEFASEVWPTGSSASECSGGTYDPLNLVCLKKQSSGNPAGVGIGEGDYPEPLQDVGDTTGSWTFTDVTVRNSDNYTSENKFAYNFIFLLDQEYKDGCEGEFCYAITKDGMSWVVEDHFSDASQKYALVSVDINGDEVGAHSSTGSNPDLFRFKVEPDGAVSVFGNDAAATKAKAVLKSRNLKASN